MIMIMMMMMICLSAGQACPKGWQKYGQSCFYMPGDIRDWHDARRACRLREADLASVTSPGMWRFLGGES